VVTGVCVGNKRFPGRKDLRQVGAGESACKPLLVMRDAVFKDTLKMGNKLLGALEGHVQEQQITIGDPVVNVQQMISS
jgi:hypothetical protein